MRIRVGYDIGFDVPYGATFLALLRAHGSRQPDLESSDAIGVDRAVAIEPYEDAFGNFAARFAIPAGAVTLSASSIVRDSGEPHPVVADAPEIPVAHLPPETLLYLYNSRYCEVDLLSTGRDATDVAITTTFGATTLMNFSVITEEVGGAS